MKKLMFFLLILLNIPINCYAEQNQYQLTINGKLTETKKEIIVLNDNCYLSAVDLGILLTDEHEFWQNDSDYSIAVKKETEFSYAVSGCRYAIEKNKIKKLSVAPIWRNDSLYLPISFCAKVSDHYLIKSKSYLQFFKWS